MVFKRKQDKNKVEEIKQVEEVISPEADVIKMEEEVEEKLELSPETPEDPDNQLNSILNNFENRIQILEATIFRLKNI